MLNPTANASLVNINKEVNKIKLSDNKNLHIKYNELKFLCKLINKFLDKNFDAAINKWTKQFNEHLRVLYSNNKVYENISNVAKKNFTHFIINEIINSKISSLKKRKLFRIQTKYPSLALNFPFIDQMLVSKEF